MTTIHYILIYVAGYVASYLFIKWSFTKHNGIWTKSNRATMLTLATFSWITFIAGLFVHIIITAKDDTPASW